jgi:hypothetical protein
MTGPGHYRAAENLMDEAADEYGSGANEGLAQYLMDRARVHAALAQTAMDAMAEGVKIGAVSVNRLEEWLRAIGIFGTGEPEAAP